jgi:hypothetical protein
LFAVTEVRAAAANLFSSLEPPEGEGEGGQAPLEGLEADIRDAVYQSAARTDSFEVYQQVECNCSATGLTVCACVCWGGGLGG